MFINLFLKECKQNAKSIVFLFIVVLLAIFTTLQYETPTNLAKPVEGQESYGEKHTTNKDIIMSTALTSLLREYEQNTYATYPIAFYKKVTLSDKKAESMQKIIENITGQTVPSISEIKEKNKDENYKGIEYDKYKSVLDYDSFIKQMDKVCEILGKGSNYEQKEMEKDAKEPETYEDAIKEYNDFVKKDKVSNACARYFCDYVGIMLAILPIFLAVSRCLKDKKNLASQVIYSKQASSWTIILTRYLSIVALMFLLVLVLSIQPIFQCIYLGKSFGLGVDKLAFIKLSIIWLLPTILCVTSVGFFITELTDSALAILFQIVVFFISIFSNLHSMVGGIGINLVPRFNTIGDTDIYLSKFNELLANRFMYTGLAILLLVITVYIYDAKRKGVFSINGKNPKVNKSKSEN